jgi:threonine dehydrogenase-like Zn-dependent dehydrogenase
LVQWLMLARKWSDYVCDIEEFFETGPPSVDVVIEASGYVDNVSKIFRRMNANGRIVLMARSGAPLTLDAIDHMITNAMSISGSRGHLGGAFAKILKLYENGRLPLNEIVTDIVKGPEGLCDLLRIPDKILMNNCKVLVRLNG